MQPGAGQWYRGPYCVSSRTSAAPWARHSIAAETLIRGSIRFRGAGAARRLESMTPPHFAHFAPRAPNHSLTENQPRVPQSRHRPCRVFRFLLFLFPTLSPVLV